MAWRWLRLGCWRAYRWFAGLCDWFAFDELSGALVQKGTTGNGDFSVSLLILSAAVMKADGKLLKSELEYIKTFFLHQFGKETTEQRMLLFKEILSPHGLQISS